MGYLMRMRRNVRSNAKNIFVIDVHVKIALHTVQAPSSPSLFLSLSFFSFYFVFPLKSIENVVVAVNGVDKAKKIIRQTDRHFMHQTTTIHQIIETTKIFTLLLLCVCAFLCLIGNNFLFRFRITLVIYCAIFFVSINHSARHSMYTRGPKESTKKIVSIKAKVYSTSQRNESGNFKQKIESFARFK